MTLERVNDRKNSKINSIISVNERGSALSVMGSFNPFRTLENVKTFYSVTFPLQRIFKHKNISLSYD